MIRSFALAALATLSFSFAQSADAAFTVVSTIGNVTSSNSTVVFAGTTATVSGVTIGFNDNTATTNGTRAFANEGFVFTNSNFTGPATTLTFTVNIAVQGVQNVFTQTSTYLLDVNGLSLQSSTFTPTTFTIDGSTYTGSNPRGTDLGLGDPTAQASTSLTINQTPTVPEPASMAMLGLGLVGTAGFAARRRLARA